MSTANAAENGPHALCTVQALPPFHADLHHRACYTSLLPSRSSPLTPFHRLCYRVLCSSRVLSCCSLTTVSTRVKCPGPALKFATSFSRSLIRQLRIEPASTVTPSTQQDSLSTGERSIAVAQMRLNLRKTRLGLPNVHRFRRIKPPEGLGRLGPRSIKILFKVTYHKANCLMGGSL